MVHFRLSVFDAHFQAVRVLKSSRSLTITVLTGAVSTLSLELQLYEVLTLIWMLFTLRHHSGFRF